MTIIETEAEAYVVEDDSKKKKKKKKKKAQTSDEAYVVAEASTASPKKPKSSKKPKSERKPKSKKKSKTKEVEVVGLPVLEASGFEPLLIRELNAEHTKADQAHKYAITGHESQIVTVEIPAGESLQGEPGSMMYLSEQVQMQVTCGADWFGRCCSGENCCVLNFENHSSETGVASLVSNVPLAKVVPIELNSPSVGGSLIVQSGAYMASYGDVQVGFDCDCNLTRCCCGGMVSTNEKRSGAEQDFLYCIIFYIVLLLFLTFSIFHHFRCRAWSAKNWRAAGPPFWAPPEPSSKKYWLKAKSCSLIPTVCWPMPRRPNSI